MEYGYRGFWCVFSAIWAVVFLIMPNGDGTISTRKSGLGVIKYNWTTLILAFLPVIIWAATRDGPGYVDTNAYITMYKTVPSGLDAFRSFLKGPDIEDHGFWVYLYLLKCVFSNWYHGFLAVTAIFQSISVVNFMKRYSTNALFSIPLFIISTEYFGWLFNGLRQFMAVTIALYAVKPFLEKKYLKSILIVLLAATFHGSAIILIPMGFIATGKPWKGKSIAAILVAVFALFATSRFTNILDSATSGTQYEGSVTSWVESGDDGVNPLRVLVFSVPTVLAFLAREQINKLNDPILNMSVNMSIISTCLWLIAMVTSGVYVGRLPIYADMFNYISLPAVIGILFTKESQRTVKIVLLCMYCFFYYYQFHVAYGLF